MFEHFGHLLAITAQKVGDGSGFWITFGSYMAMVFAERLIYALRRNHEWHEREAWACVEFLLIGDL